MIFGFGRKENIFLLQHYHPIRQIHFQITVSDFPTDFDSWDMLTIIGSRSPYVAFSGAQGHLLRSQRWNSAEIRTHGFMVVLVTCKNEEDPIKNEGSRVLTRFSPL